MDSVKEYSTIDELIALSQSTTRTVNRRLGQLKKNDREIYDSLLNTNKASRKKEYHTQRTLAYLSSPSKGITPSKPKQTKTGPQKKKPVGARLKIKKNIEKIAESIWAEPVIIQMDKETKTAYDDIKTDDDKRRFEMVVLIINDWVTGLYTIGQACDRQGGNLRTFQTWISNSTSLAELYKRGEKKRNKALKALTIQDAETNLKRLITGYEVDMETTTFIDRTLPNGTKLSIPQERKVQRKHVVPNVTAIMFGLTNLKSKKYRRFQQFQQETPPAPDPIDSMDERQLMQYIEEGKQSGLMPEQKP